MKKEAIPNLMGCDCISHFEVNPLKLKSGTKSTKTRDFSVKSGTLLKISPEFKDDGEKRVKIAKFVVV